MTNLARDKAFHIWNQILKMPQLMFMESETLMKNLMSAARYLAETGQLDIVMYDFHDRNHVRICESHMCTIVETTGLIMCDGTYVCRTDDLYRVSDHGWVFIIDFSKDHMKNIELIAKMAWKWLDIEIGENWNMNRAHEWTDLIFKPQNFAPYYVINMGILMNKNAQIRAPFPRYMAATWNLVCNDTCIETLIEEYPDLAKLRNP